MVSVACFSAFKYTLLNELFHQIVWVQAIVLMIRLILNEGLLPVYYCSKILILSGNVSHSKTSEPTISLKIAATFAQFRPDCWFVFHRNEHALSNHFHDWAITSVEIWIHDNYWSWDYESDILFWVIIYFYYTPMRTGNDLIFRKPPNFLISNPNLRWVTFWLSLRHKKAFSIFFGTVWTLTYFALTLWMVEIL